MSIRRKKLGLGDAKSPTAGGSRSCSKCGCKHPRLEHSTTRKFLPVYIQGGTCSTLCDISGAHADLGRHIARFTEEELAAPIMSREEFDRQQVVELYKVKAARAGTWI